MATNASSFAKQKQKQTKEIETLHQNWRAAARFYPVP
jgi:hypothetical protein